MLNRSKETPRSRSNSKSEEPDSTDNYKTQGKFVKSLESFAQHEESFAQDSDLSAGPSTSGSSLDSKAERKRKRKSKKAKSSRESEYYIYDVLNNP